MITASQISGLRVVETDDYCEAKRLKRKYAKLRTERHPFFLMGEEFDEILKWKLGQQYNRQKKIRQFNTDEIIRSVTNLALNITHNDKDYEMELRIGILCVLRGVHIPVASAILALVFPYEYAIIDFRVWRQFFGEDKKNKVFSIGDYRRYMVEVRRLAQELGWHVQKVDYAIWEYDRRLDGYS